MGNHYEPGIQIPMIVRHPDGIGKGTTNTALVTLADLTPTILDWTQTKGPEYALHGRSFLPVLNKRTTNGLCGIGCPCRARENRSAVARPTSMIRQVTGRSLTVLDVDLDDIQDQEVLEKHPGLLRKAGHIGLLGHGSRVEFRNLRVKELP